jgi:hypothetical protein
MVKPIIYLYFHSKILKWKGKEMDEKEFLRSFFQWRIPKKTKKQFKLIEPILFTYFIFKIYEIYGESLSKEIFLKSFFQWRIPKTLRYPTLLEIKKLGLIRVEGEIIRMKTSIFHPKEINNEIDIRYLIMKEMEKMGLLKIEKSKPYNKIYMNNYYFNEDDFKKNIKFSDEDTRKKSPYLPYEI